MHQAVARKQLVAKFPQRESVVLCQQGGLHVPCQPSGPKIRIARSVGFLLTQRTTTTFSIPGAAFWHADNSICPWVG